MYITSRVLALFLLASAVLACDARNGLRGVRIAQYSRDESEHLLNQFLTASAANDTGALLAIATTPVRQQVTLDRREGRFLEEYRAAGTSHRVRHVDVVLGGADVEFTYEVGGQPRNGRASVRFEDGRWQVSEFALMVEY